MRIGVLTSSSADYGIYLPLLKELKGDKNISFNLIVFGTHLSKKHGYTITNIINDKFPIFAKIKTVADGDSPIKISESIGKTISQFSKFWNKNDKKFDLVLCLGDRYEMFAAVTAGISFGIKFAHFHGGETSLGAIDESFRHSITAMSSIHFAATEKSLERIVGIKGNSKNCYNVGALSLDNLKTIKLLTKNEFKSKFGVLPENPILVTFHPETVNYKANSKFVAELSKVLASIKTQVFITLPNADTNGEIIRKVFLQLEKSHKHIHCFNSLGTQGYFSAMSCCSFLMGNSSSGIIEAASFGKYVINLGDRQKGRERSANVVDCPIDKNAILNELKKIKKNLTYTGSNIYGDGKSSRKVKKILEKKY